ncbi:MAG: hypothetical protein ACREKM_04320 [Longimicrobiales bacterium]
MTMERVERDAWITKQEFHRRLTDWYRHGSAPLVGDPAVPGMTGWVWVREGHLLAKLNADTSRAAVGAYLDMLHERRGELSWSVVESARGQTTKIVFGSEQRVIPGFYLYLYKVGI